MLKNFEKFYKHINKRRCNQKGAILIMTVFLIFVYIAFAALFVDGFRLWETKQEIDSYAEYATEGLHRKIIEEIKNYNECIKKCEEENDCSQNESDCINCKESCKNIENDTSSDYSKCTKNCSEDDEKCFTECDDKFNQKCIESQNGYKIYNCANNLRDFMMDEIKNKGIMKGKKKNTLSEYYCRYRSLPDDHIQLCQDDKEALWCRIVIKTHKENFIFAGIFADQKTGEIPIRVCVKSCYDPELERSNIFPYYFEPCNH